MKTVLIIEGMSCAHCVRHVTDALEELSGVTSADVSLEEKTADVEHAETVTLGDMKAALTEAGYDVV